MLAVIGPNGAGKSTVFNMVGGQLRPDRGEVRLDGEPITGLSPLARFHRGVGRTFQVAQTFWSMTAVENVQMALISREGRARAPWPAMRRLRRQEAAGILDRVGMGALADRPCATLAYGDVKRLELAVALAGRPRLLLMDEPTAGMAAAERAALMELASSAARAERLGVLFTEHDMDVVFGHADRVLVLMDGEIIAAGPPAAVRADPRVRQAYLGDLAALRPAEPAPG
jgi:branched-chain amino acid transport system ATP-binding protein